MSPALVAAAPSVVVQPVTLLPAGWVLMVTRSDSPAFTPPAVTPAVVTERFAFVFTDVPPQVDEPVRSLPSTTNDAPPAGAKSLTFESVNDVVATAPDAPVALTA